MAFSYGDFIKPLETRLEELDKLEIYLKKTGVLYERIDVDGTKDNLYIDRHQIIVYRYSKDGRKHRAWDAICHYGSYGYDVGLLELMDETGEVHGFLTAKDVINKMGRDKNEDI